MSILLVRTEQNYTMKGVMSAPYVQNLRFCD